MTHKKLVQGRIQKLVILSFTVLIVFALRLIQVQAVQADAYTARAQIELMSSSVLLAPRGTITDINGVELARSVAAVNVVVDQTMIANPASAAALAAPVLNIPAAKLQILLTGAKRYQMIVKNVAPAVWQSLNDQLKSFNSAALKEPGGLAKRIVGFFSERGYIRNYPTGALASSLVGITNDANVGASGIESSMNSELSGANGSYIYANGAGTIIPGSQQIKTEARSGTSLQLTIDRDIQWVAQDAITTAVKSAHAKSGTVIVMDPKTGSILAQASAPNFDPAKKKTITLASLRNPAVQDVYEPGSTGKVITIAAAMEEGKITPQTVFTIPYGLSRGGRIFHDHEKHSTERLTATGLLAISSNTGAIQVGETMSNTTLYNYLHKFGIGQSTNSHLPGESAGILHPVDQWSRTSAPTMAFGQGYSLTAMQATSVFATIANDGVRVTPNVVAGLIDANGNYSPTKMQSSERVVGVETAQKLRIMMESVVSENGTAPSAAIPGYRVAGKTGTAMRIDEKCGCYKGYTASFIGFAPADSPKYVVSVAIQDPQGMHWGGYLGGPVFKKVMSFVLESRHIPPTVGKPTTYPLTEAELKKVQREHLAAVLARAAKKLTNLTKLNVPIAIG
jgi:cell division protein FtsI (penicillin-binding protein 3)